MDNKEASQLRERARKLAIKMGFYWESEDIAQEAMLLLAKRKTVPRLLDRLVIDAARSFLGDPRAHKRKANLMSEFFPIHEMKELFLEEPERNIDLGLRFGILKRIS